MTKTITITAVDIWQEVLEENDYSFYGEKTGTKSETNCYEFFKGLLKCSIYFNYKTGEVSNVFFSNDDKDYFISQFNSKLRDYKLKSILD